MADVPETRSPFTGRWIARIGNKIICQGGSPDQVFKAAKSIRGKETIIISFIPLSQIMSFPPIFNKIQEILSHEQNIYLVGGAVRNALLNQVANDLDFTVSIDVERIARSVSRELNTDFYPLDIEREAYRLIMHLPEDKVQYLDFSRMRGENIDADLLARDFTINAMAVNINDPQKLIDPLGGARDLMDKKIRVCSPKSIQDDPIRILRAIRFAAEGGYKLEDETRWQLKTNVGLLSSTSPERIRDELFKMLKLDQLPAALRALEWLRSYPFLFPNLYVADSHTGEKEDGFQEKLDFSSSAEIIRLVRMISLRNSAGDAESLIGGMVVSGFDRFRERLCSYLNFYNTPDRDNYQLIQLSNLLLVLNQQDTAPLEITQLIARGMNLSRDEIEAFSIMTTRWALIDEVLKAEPKLDRRKVYRFFKATGSTGIALMVLYIGRYISRKDKKFDPDELLGILERSEFLLDVWWNRYTEIVNPKPFMNGDEIIQHFHLSPGPMIGRYLEYLKEEQAAGEIISRDAAMDLLTKLQKKTI